MRDRFTWYLARVRAGETVVITDRGQPIAVLKPPGRSTSWAERLAEMAASGLVAPPARVTARPRKALRLAGKPLSAYILEDREERI